MFRVHGTSGRLAGRQGWGQGCVGRVEGGVGDLSSMAWLAGVWGNAGKRMLMEWKDDSIAGVQCVRRPGQCVWCEQPASLCCVQGGDLQSLIGGVKQSIIGKAD